MKVYVLSEDQSGKGKEWEIVGVVTDKPFAERWEAQSGFRVSEEFELNVVGAAGCTPIESYEKGGLTYLREVGSSEDIEC